MDAVAVAIASGLSVTTLRLGDALKLSLMFGAFQGLMPVAGFILGRAFADWLGAIDHWVAFFVLGGLGVKMLFEAREAASERIHSPFQLNKLLVMAVATSIDALAVGVSFALMEISLTQAAFTIGVTTFVLCLPAVWFGARLGKVFAQRAEFAGGLVLIAIGSKILIEHLVTGI